MKLVDEISRLPQGIACRTWTVREDNAGHYHGQVSVAESPMYITILWRANGRSPVRNVGTFRLHLPELLENGLIRKEKSPKARGDLRVRFASERGRIFVETRKGQSRLLVGTAK